MLFNSGFYTASYYSYDEIENKFLILSQSNISVDNSYNNLEMFLQEIAGDIQINITNILSIESGTFSIILNSSPSYNLNTQQINSKLPNLTLNLNKYENNNYPIAIEYSKIINQSMNDAGHNPSVYSVKLKNIEELPNLNVDSTTITDLKKFDTETETIILNTVDIIYINAPTSGGGGGGGGGTPQVIKYKYDFMIKDSSGEWYRSFVVEEDNYTLPAGAVLLEKTRV